MNSLDFVACVGGGIVLLTYALLMCYLQKAEEKKKDLIIGPFKHWLGCWTVLCFISAGCSVALYLEISKDPNEAVAATLGAFLSSAALWAPLTILDVERRSTCSILFLGLSMLATPCAWLVFFATGPAPTFLSCILFTWTFAHHLLFDSWIWFAIYLDRRSCRLPRV